MEASKLPKGDVIKKLKDHPFCLQKIEDLVPN